MNFTWWVNREDADGSNLFEGGFLGLDNIGPIDRDHLPVAGMLEQSDATAWMALYSLHMGTMASVLARHGQPTLDLTLKFLEHFVLIKRALDDQGLWDEQDGFFYDRIELADGSLVPIKVRSMVGVLPVLASVVIDEVLIRPGRDPRQGLRRLLGATGFDLDDMAERGSGPGRAGRAAAADRRGRRRQGARGSSTGSSPRTSSSLPTACGRSRRPTATIRTSSRSAISAPASTTSRPSRPPTCSAATPTGAARSGSR